VNNYGRIDKDRSFDNPDGTIRIFLQGECWTEGEQTLTHQHMNVVLESMLRRRFGVPVEVILSATSDASPASYSRGFEKYGARFHPDLVLLFVNPFNMTHMEPWMLRELIGWDKEHSPYQMFDFDAKGKLVCYPPDPQFPAYTVAAKNTKLIGTAPLDVSYGVTGQKLSKVDRSFSLLRAILKQEYVDRLGGQARRLALIYGYDNCILTYGQSYTGCTAADDRWLTSAKEFCQDMGIIPLDLSRHLPRRYYPWMTWECDNHPTGTGHYRIAAALADEIAALPEFRELVEHYRQRENVAEKPRP
jgi:hypothetical protein